MIRYQIAYRFKDGTVQGFVQGCFSEASARRAVITDATKACLNRSELFDASRLIESKKAVTKQEMDTIKKDWSKGRGKGILATKSDLLGK